MSFHEDGLPSPAVYSDININIINIINNDNDEKEEEEAAGKSSWLRSFIIVNEASSAANRLASAVEKLV